MMKGIEPMVFHLDNWHYIQASRIKRINFSKLLIGDISRIERKGEGNSTMIRYVPRSRDE